MINITTRENVFLEDIDIEKVLVAKKIFSEETNYIYFFGYLENDFKVKSLHLKLPKTSTYTKSYDGQTKWIFFLIEDDDLLHTHDTNWDKASADINKEFDSKPVFWKKSLKTKKKFMVMMLQIFLINKFLRCTLTILRSSNQLGICSQKKRKLLFTIIFKRV